MCEAPFISWAITLAYGGGAAKLVEGGHGLPALAACCFQKSALESSLWCCGRSCLGCDDAWPMVLEDLPEDKAGSVVRDTLAGEAVVMVVKFQRQRDRRA